jgi:hypothetical protein
MIGRCEREGENIELGGLFCSLWTKKGVGRSETCLVVFASCKTKCLAILNSDGSTSRKLCWSLCIVLCVYSSIRRFRPTLTDSAEQARSASSPTRDDGNIQCQILPKECTEQTNSVAFSPQTNNADWTTATSRPNLVPTFADRGVSHGQRGGSPRSLILAFETGAATFLSSDSSFIITVLSGPRSRPTASQNIW